MGNENLTLLNLLIITFSEVTKSRQISKELIQ